MASVSHRDGSGSVSLGVASVEGAGSPEGVVTADVGSVYRRIDGGAGTTLYVKESGSGNTGWVAFSGLSEVSASIAALQAADVAEAAARAAADVAEAATRAAADTSLGNRMTAAESDIDALEDDVGDLETDVAAAELAIDDLADDVAALQADVMPIYMVFNSSPGSGSGSATMAHCGQTADVNNSPTIAPVSGEFTAIRVGATGTAAAPASGTLAFRVDLNNVSGTTVHTLTFPTVSGTTSFTPIAVSAGDRVRIVVTKDTVPTDGGVFIAWLTLVPS